MNHKHEGKVSSEVLCARLDELAREYDLAESGCGASILKEAVQRIRELETEIAREDLFKAIWEGCGGKL